VGRLKKKAQPVKTARILFKGASETADARDGRNNALRKLASRFKGRNKKKQNVAGRAERSNSLDSTSGASPFFRVKQCLALKSRSNTS
jgi:hypothetical protein